MRVLSTLRDARGKVRGQSQVEKERTAIGCHLIEQQIRDTFICQPYRLEVTVLLVVSKTDRGGIESRGRRLVLWPAFPLNRLCGVKNQAQRVFQRQRSGQTGRRQFACSFSQDACRDNLPGAPERGQGDLLDKMRG